MKKLLIILVIITLSLPVKAQKDSLSSKIFANLYSTFYYELEQSAVQSGFIMPTALLGYNKKHKKISGTIIFDVTRTTNAISVFDTSGYKLPVTYFEGSKYTAFLKMAEIKYALTKNLSISTGQLLSNQYLTLQDKFWQHRYIEVTYQELNRFGMPADFGLRLQYKKGILDYSFTVVNGEGPFRHQDANSNFLYSSNIVLRPNSKVVAKLYTSYWSTSQDSLTPQKTVSLFLGYRTSSFTTGLEANFVKNAKFGKDNWSGASFFAFKQINKQFQLLYRFDYTLCKEDIQGGQYHILGLEFQPQQELKASLNLRYNSLTNTKGIFLNFGLKI